ncbi:pleckstrin homology domain-containing family G member 6-like [Halichondria panicea]|uniref:pleckstrin homology domain-containing family G member 6-like n=1 Tax=Halichondria panicea TaxID=6063 RepID=UPI00312B7A46
MSLGNPEQMLVVTASDDEVSKLQDQLYQALFREAEAHKKIRHLHEQLMDTRRCSSSRSPNGLRIGMETPDLPWADTDLSQNSEVSPQSPTPALIVSMTPPQRNVSRLRSISQPCSPKVTGLGGLVNLKSLSEESHSNEQVHPKEMNGTVHHNMAGVWSPTNESLHVFTNEHLAPLSRQLSDVITEREKPPPSPASQRRSCSLHNIAKNTLAPIQLVKRQTSPEPVAVSPPESVKSLDNEPLKFGRTSPPTKKPLTVTNSLGRDTTAPKKKSSQRGRSNSMISTFFRRKRATLSETHISREEQHKTFSIEQIFQTFSQIPITNQRDSLAKYIDRPWTDVCLSGESSQEDIQYHNTVWDMFQQEIKYLTNLLQPLELVYKGFLDELHFHGILKIADVDKIFANLSGLCELSSSIAEQLFQMFNGRSGNKIAPNGELIRAFSMFGHKINPVYQRFCVNFEKQRGFVRALQQLPEFQEYLLLCRTHELVQKKDLSDLLIAPMQHQCHYQLLLEKVLKYTKDPAEKAMLGSAIKAFVVSLKELEGNIDESKRSAELLELQETLSWPSVTLQDMDAYIPEEIQGLLSSQQSGEQLVTKDRQLVYKGILRLLDSKAKPCHELHVFLFTDFLLFTELKSSKKESNQLIRYHVYGHPLFLESIELHDVTYNATHKHIVTIVEKTALQQKIKVYSLQAAGKDDKNKWLTQIFHAQDLLWHRQNDHYIESDV